MSSLAETNSTLPPKPRLKPAYSSSRVLQPSLAMLTLGGQRMISRLLTISAVTGIWRAPRRISFDGSVSLQLMTWKT